jgi:hypothetical protein
VVVSGGDLQLDSFKELVMPLFDPLYNFAHPMTLTPKIFFVCKDFQGVYAATAVSWAVTGVSWATVERNALRIATMILRPLEVSW